ncbi:MAG: phage holin family protein [Thermoanaerobaculia bacterium]|nr:phage holin family protein [Thermoanaerobaculia bacterium]
MSRTTWIGAFRALGEAVLGLVRAEVDALFEEWKRAGVELAKILALLFFALLIFVYLPFLGLFAAVDGVAAWWGWPMWAAALAVLGFAVLFLGLLGGIVAWIWNRRLEAPTASLQRRLDDHGEWWQRRVYFEQQAMESTAQSSGDEE